jgi:hypothetical protein
MRRAGIGREYRTKPDGFASGLQFWVTPNRSLSGNDQWFKKSHSYESSPNINQLIAARNAAFRPEFVT